MTERDLFGNPDVAAREVIGERFSGLILRETNAAILFGCEEENVWLPKSRINFISHSTPCINKTTGEVHQTVTVFIPTWLAKEKGLMQ